MKIFKYVLQLGDGVTGHLMPKSSKILSTGLDCNDDICVWILIDEKEGVMETRYFRIYGTGNKHFDETIIFIGTVPVYRYYSVWHIFEIIDKD